MDLVSFSDPSRGNPDAPVLVVEFFDPLCPHCKTMAPVMDKIIEDYGDKARFVYRPFVIFPQSMQMVEALHAAAQQGKFFEMMDAQFARQTNRALTMAELEEIATEIGADWELMKHRLDNQMFRSVAIRHRNSSSQAGVGVVPTIMINGRIIKSEAKTIPCIKELIDRSTPS
jgi:protein-disulfide isomerase